MAAVKRSKVVRWWMEDLAAIPGDLCINFARIPPAREQTARARAHTHTDRIKS